MMYNEGCQYECEVVCGVESSDRQPMSSQMCSSVGVVNGSVASLEPRKAHICIGREEGRVEEVH